MVRLALGLFLDNTMRGLHIPTSSEKRTSSTNNVSPRCACVVVGLPCAPSGEGRGSDRAQTDVPRPPLGTVGVSRAAQAADHV